MMLSCSSGTQLPELIVPLRPPTEWRTYNTGTSLLLCGLHWPLSGPGRPKAAASLKLESASPWFENSLLNNRQNSTVKA